MNQFQKLILILAFLACSVRVFAQNQPTFIPTKWEYRYVPKAETTREGGWQQEWSWDGFWKTYWLSYRFKTGIEVQLYMDNEQGGMSFVGSAIHWFPSEDCDDIDWDVKNCTGTVRDNLFINSGSFNGDEYKELTYNGYHSTEHIIWDATSNFYNKVKTQDLKDLVNHMIGGYISQYTDNYLEVNTKCNDCAGKSKETTCGITPKDLGLTLTGEYTGKESQIDYFFTCDVINRVGITNVASTIDQIIKKSYIEPPDVPLNINGDNTCLSFTKPPSADYAGRRIDKRFNLVGSGSKLVALRTGLEYYTLEGNYSTPSYPSSMVPGQDNLPAINHKVVREVGKLLQANAASVGFGITEEEMKARVKSHYSSTGDFVAYTFGLDQLGYDIEPFHDWYNPDVDAIMNIEGPKIDEMVALEKSNQIEGTMWEIGNEPNMHVRLDPKDYARLYIAYHKRLHNAGLPEKSRIALGAFIIPELLQQTRSRFVDIAIHDGNTEFNEKIEPYAVWGHAVSGGAGVAVFIVYGANGPSFVVGTLTTAGLEAIGHGLAEYGRYTAKRMSREIGNQLADAVLNVPTAEYLEEVLLEISKIAPEVLPQLDVVSLHAYRYEESAPFIGSCQLEQELKSVFDQVKYVFQKYTGKEVNIWVTEFGNISDPDGSTAQEIDELAEQRMSQMTSFFSSRPEVERWFWYKSIGGDKALEQLGLTPNSRLFMNSPGVTAENPYFEPLFTYFDQTTLTNLGRNYFSKALMPTSDVVNPPLGENPASSNLSSGDDGGNQPISPIGAGSFDRLVDWTSTNLNSALSLSAWPYTEGTGAIQLTGTSSTLRMEMTTGATIYNISDRLALDVWLPKIPVQDYGNGQINMFISSTDGLLNNYFVGTALLDKLAQNNFNTLFFSVTPQLQAYLQTLKAAGTTIKVALEIWSPLNGLILDNLRFQLADPEVFDDRTPTADILGFENIGNWSSPDASDFRANLNHTQGVRSLEFNHNSTLVSSGNLWSDPFAADESGISIANYVNLDVFPNANGEVQISLHCPEHYIHNDWVGRRTFGNLPQGAWSRISFEIPSHIRQNLNTFSPYCRTRLSLINVDGPILMDSMSFSVNSEEKLAYATNSNPNAGSPNAIQVAKNQELVLPAGQHILKLTTTASWPFTEFDYNISPRDGISMKFTADGNAVNGWIYQGKVACTGCKDVFITLDLPVAQTLMFQWWEQ